MGPVLGGLKRNFAAAFLGFWFLAKNRPVVFPSCAPCLLRSRPELFASKSTTSSCISYCSGIYSSAASCFNCCFNRFATVSATLLQTNMSKTIALAVDSPHIGVGQYLSFAWAWTWLTFQKVHTAHSPHPNILPTRSHANRKQLSFYSLRKGSWNYRLKFDVDLPLKSPEHGRLVLQVRAWFCFTTKLSIVVPLSVTCTCFHSCRCELLAACTSSCDLLSARSCDLFAVCMCDLFVVEISNTPSWTPSCYDWLITTLEKREHAWEIFDENESHSSFVCVTHVF